MTNSAPRAIRATQNPVIARAIANALEDGFILIELPKAERSAYIARAEKELKIIENYAHDNIIVLTSSERKAITGGK